jgi:hypothetical protein
LESQRALGVMVARHGCWVMMGCSELGVDGKGAWRGGVLWMGRAGCWRSLTSIINRQYYLHIYLITSPNIGIGVWTNEFHEFWCSHLFCGTFNFLLNKSISNDELKCTITKSSPR